MLRSHVGRGITDDVKEGSVRIALGTYQLANEFVPDRDTGVNAHNGPDLSLPLRPRLVSGRAVFCDACRMWLKRHVRLSSALLAP